ncbi:hypothetical protein BBJ28_00002583 [Nothophytophthora sp. Chile5]|nr:hypothetical protein BBJ28_00002583 [Nothophytophthora sp. Chile5]
MMASMHAELPRPSSLAGGGSGGADDIAGTGIAGKARSWLLQRPYPEENRRETGDIASNEDKKAPVPKKRTSAAALVLARKRKRDEQRKKLGAVSGKKQCMTAHGSSEHQAEDDGEDSYDVEQQLTAFVEYVRDNATDMDSLDINPSQDFDVMPVGELDGRYAVVCTIAASLKTVYFEMARRSVKRDCSFVENKYNSPDGRLLLTASSTVGRKPSSITVIELKDNCFDSSDDVEEGPTGQEPPLALSTSVPTTVDTMAVVSSSSTSIFGVPSRALGFQPRLVKKRRKVDQLTLDGFFQAKPWT